ncbi:MAG: 2-succinyl-5-enolpyruvyl-6-hydroxy-3-cyclohexene-1-carboxylic-acid synthase [Candidatus Kapabacteria bacterium]|jgi:2-succinyl-5-enolpyruvyl-6-hydroxy-3-cyclohexene-1-carboxylate synthase|nr:2-succinyl-5-enolpyruvyl-6-hydroxy-3-cyclohexene-1-carboxylic-acid synthase [Candidatus Kapabacteria bacterium]
MNTASSATFAQSENLNILWARLMIEECIRCGVRMFCVSPGSRSTPLAVALQRASEEHSGVQIVVGTDERAAAFYALGYARATRIPAVLLCTSGTAVANYLPAVVEAAQDAVPMLLLTADRPPELRDNGANQTIRQPHIFGDYVRWEFDIPCPSEEISPAFLLSTVSHAVFRASTSPEGAVHLNCQFREPLAPTQKAFSPDYLEPAQKWLESSHSWTIHAPSVITPFDAVIRNIAQTLASAQNPLISVGRLNTRSERDAVLQCAYMWRMPIVADVASGLRLHDVPNTIPYFDQTLLLPEMYDGIKPDAVLHIGGTFTSKRLLQWFAAIQPTSYIAIEHSPFRHDANHQVTMRVQGDIVATMNRLYKAASGMNTESAFAVKAFHASQEVESIIESYIAEALNANTAISEITATMLVSKHIPSESGLFLSNSMPVRDMDMLALTQHESGFIHVGTNRGASGIDGILATAAGFAEGIKKPVTLMIGDLALIHDTNSLLLAAKNKTPLIIIAINNNGGGIFSFLPVASDNAGLSTQAFERFWGTPHGVSFKALAEFADIRYEAPTTTQDFETSYKQALERSLGESSSTLIEIRTDRTANVQEHKALQALIISCLQAL